MRIINTPNFFWWFLIMIVFFQYFLQNLYNSLECAINFPHGVMTKNRIYIFDPIFKLLLWQNQKRYTKSYYFRNSSICKKKLFLFYTFFQNCHLFLSYKISTWPQASSGCSKYWPLTFTFKILALTDFVDQNEQTVHCAWLCCKKS